MQKMKQFPIKAKGLPPAKGPAGKGAMPPGSGQMPAGLKGKVPAKGK